MFSPSWNGYEPATMPIPIRRRKPASMGWICTAFERRWRLSWNISRLNVGQLARQRYGNDAVLIGFTTYDGMVTAASEWGGPAERKRVRAASADSHEGFLHRYDGKRFWLDTANPAVVAL